MDTTHTNTSLIELLVRTSQEQHYLRLLSLSSALNASEDHPVLAEYSLSSLWSFNTLERL